ncbi:outer membrane lipoprotein-sorting protein [Cerasicoccus maritimus]|uniref:outer membrane lipoprotein-sorting protein n=1 Tax=Cerasicoccus maritimus TaxID=490089 RepID=UPI002852A09D|nr:outer membrane lipoprotein-sorting protein [Cerasicoccus maritimus]
MKKNYFTLSLAIILTPLVLQADETAQLNGRQLMEQYVASQTVDSELAFIELKTFETETPTDEVIKKRLIALTEKKNDGAYDYLIRMVLPKDIEGVSVLSNISGDTIDQYLYLPAQGKPLKLGSVGSGQFMGSDFAYEDLVRETPGNYTYTRLPDAVAQGEICAVVQAVPASEDSSQYAARNIFLDPTTFEVRKIEFYDELDGEPVKELQAYEYRSPDVDGTTVRPRFAVMTNMQTGTISVFKVLKSRLNLPIENQFFEAEYLPSISEADVNGLLVEIDDVGN